MAPRVKEKEKTETSKTKGHVAHLETFLTSLDGCNITSDATTNDDEIFFLCEEKNEPSVSVARDSLFHQHRSTAYQSRWHNHVLIVTSRPGKMWRARHGKSCLPG